MCVRWKADVQHVSHEPDKVSLVFLCVCHIQSKICVNYTELGNGSRLIPRSCRTDSLIAHGGEKKNWSVNSVEYSRNIGPG